MDADRLLNGPSCLIVKDQKKIKVARLSVKIHGAIKSLYLKRYNAFSLHDTVLANIVRTGALRSLRGAQTLNQAGIATVIPVAAVENRRWGIVYKSFFISEEVAGGKTLDAFWREDLLKLAGKEGVKRRRAFLSRLADLFRTLHAQQIYHGDLKDANILVVAPAQERPMGLFLIDLESVRRYRRLNERRRVKNLVQIYRTLGRYVARPQRLFFLKRYLGPLFGDRRVKRRWARRVLGFARQIEEFKARRRG